MKKSNKTEGSSNASLFSFLLLGFAFDKSVPKSKTSLVMLLVFILLFGCLALFLVKMAGAR
ncbi:hypothetical protein [Rheinheimera faecalis]|jgi:hypothetical protein|uniref:hypothetical protein n=1 Tax=Rheinheimera faecalis TaxID=2901141 RepID=UPI001E3DD989|nr:hypothetical protein [Rheinheimera faecalis]